MKDIIYREDAIKSMANAIWHYPNELYTGLNSYEMCEALAKDGLMRLPSADLSDYCDKLWKLAYERGKAEGQEKQKEPCGACGNLENGDTLYSMSDWDGGIGFDYIRDIEYCPVCGRKL